MSTCCAEPVFWRMFVGGSLHRYGVGVPLSKFKATYVSESGEVYHRRELSKSHKEFYALPDVDINAKETLDIVLGRLP